MGLMSRVLASTSSYRSDSSPELDGAVHYSSASLPKRPMSPSFGDLESRKKVRKPDAVFMNEQEEASDGPADDDGSRLAENAVSLSSANSSMTIDAERWAWNSVEKSLVIVSPSTAPFEILRFPSGSYLGSVSPADSRTNDFIRSQQCVSSCSKRFKKDERPWRMRKHYVECQKRKAEFEQKGETDPLARLCELQLAAQGTSLTRSRGRDSRSGQLGPTISVDGPRSMRSGSRPHLRIAEEKSSDADDEAEEDEDDFKPPCAPRLHADPRPSRPKPQTLSLASAAVIKPRGPKFIEASTGRVTRKLPQQLEPKMWLRVIIHNDINSTPILHQHPSSIDASAFLPSPRPLRPTSIARISSSTASVSHFNYALNSLAMQNGTRLSIEVGNREVHVDEEVRSWLSEEGGTVTLSVEEEGALWIRRQS